MNASRKVRRPFSGDRLLWGFVILATAVVLAGIGHSAARAAAERKADRQEAAREAPTVVTPSVRSHRVVAYYFHTTYRCASCRAIEAYSHEALETAFAGEIKDGRILWKVVNVEVKGNEHFVKDYSLYTKSLVLVNEVRGKPAEWKHLEKVWQFLPDKPRFLRYVQDETRAYLTERS
jgi:hypothetical protein